MSAIKRFHCVYIFQLSISRLDFNLVAEKKACVGNYSASTTETPSPVECSNKCQEEERSMFNFGRQDAGMCEEDDKQ